MLMTVIATTKTGPQRREPATTSLSITAIAREEPDYAQPAIPPMPLQRNALTNVEFWADIQLVSTEIEDALAIFYTYEEINLLAVEDGEILRLLNEDALFWKVETYSLQTSLFMILGRIFDSAQDARSIHKVVSAVVGQPQLFSKQALAVRKTTEGFPPDGLDQYIATAWAPTSPAELRYLKKELAKHSGRFEQVYRPIRNAIFAHRLLSNDQAAFKLFGETSRVEVAKILDFLHDLIDAIESLYVNGTRPELGKRSYTEYNQRIRAGAQHVLRKLATGSDSVARQQNPA